MKGSCLCGAIRYEIDGRIGPIVHCHCAMCRKVSGSSFWTHGPVRRRYLRWTRGEDAIARYRSSAGAERWFCRECGATLAMNVLDDPDTLLVASGSYDEDPGRRPACHIFVASKAPWFAFDVDSVPRFDGEPEAEE